MAVDSAVAEHHRIALRARLEASVAVEAADRQADLVAAAVADPQGGAVEVDILLAAVVVAMAPPEEVAATHTVAITKVHFLPAANAAPYGAAFFVVMGVAVGHAHSTLL
jgi:hypothetical protein